MLILLRRRPAEEEAPPASSPSPPPREMLAWGNMQHVNATVTGAGEKGQVLAQASTQSSSERNQPTRCEEKIVSVSWYEQKFQDKQRFVSQDTQESFVGLTVTHVLC